MVNGASTRDGEALMAQTWDMHASATPHVLMLHLKPQHGYEAFVYTITGCLGMIGMNSAGIAVGINNIPGADGQIGVTWPLVCRKILAQDSLDAALACITEAKLAGAHNYMILDASGNGYNVEAMSSCVRVTPLEDTALAHANACLAAETRRVQRPLDADWLTDSAVRVERALQLLSGSDDLTEADMMAITRNREDGAFSICSICEPPWAESETCGAVVMRPATGEFWGVWGLPHENDYQAFQLERAGWKQATRTA
jgi:isopenicillin-N N-acyltransferase-like protein